MKTYNILKTGAHMSRRRIIVAEINILRNYEDRQLMDDKIVREMRKLHSLWFNGTARDIQN